MQLKTFQFVLLQMDEATKLIRDGRIPHTRIALILLDNAVEVLLHEWAKDQLGWDSLRRQLYERVKQTHAPEDILGKFDLKGILPPGEERQVLRTFDRLVQYVTVTKNAVDPEIGDALLQLHRYRNEAYHRSMVRKETIRTAVFVLFDLTARLILSNVGRPRSYSSDDDYSWLSERFGAQSRNFLGDDHFWEAAVDQLRASMPVDAGNVANAMAAHLEARIDDLLDSLDFLCDTAVTPMTREQALQGACEYVLKMKRQRVDTLDRMPVGFKGKLSTATIEQIREMGSRIPQSEDALTAFKRFAAAELELEHFEFPVYELASEVDAMIQREIDRMRGK